MVKSSIFFCNVCNHSGQQIFSSDLVVLLGQEPKKRKKEKENTHKIWRTDSVGYIVKRRNWVNLLLTYKRSEHIARLLQTNCIRDEQKREVGCKK
jgi:hypothetical protein